MTKIQFNFIIYIKTFAAILIINSHYDDIYPISMLATGGAVGNALFFASSGFVLYPVTSKFCRWISKRLWQIYCPTIFITVFYIILIKKNATTELSLFQIFVWPTMFWFVGAIILFYMLFYIFKNVICTEQLICISLVLLALYFSVYFLYIDKTHWSIEENGLKTIGGCFKLIYYFSSMMIGKYVRINIDNIIHKNRNIKTNIKLAVLSFLSIYFVKFLVFKYSFLMPIQFLNHFSILFFTYYFFCIGVCLESYLKKYKGAVFRICNLVSKLTLYLYLTQFIVIYYTKSIVFPLNFIVCSSLIFCLSYFLFIIFNMIFKKLKF